MTPLGDDQLPDNMRLVRDALSQGMAGLDDHERQRLLDAVRVAALPSSTKRIVEYALLHAPVSISRQRIAERPDIEPLFGALSAARTRALQDELQEADRLVRHLGEVAGAHLGRACSVTPFELTILVRPGGVVDIDLSAFLSCAVVDIAFEVSFTATDGSPPPWPVEAWVSVLCAGRPRGDACNHELIEVKADAPTPEDVVRMVRMHIETVTEKLPHIPVDVLTEHAHDDPRTWS